jgi:hypothetical protein
VSSADQQPATSNPKRIIGLRANSLPAVAMLLIEFGLGVGLNLYASLADDQRNLPTFDH